MDEADHHDATGLLMALASAYDSGDVSGFVVFWWGGDDAGVQHAESEMTRDDAARVRSLMDAESRTLLDIFETEHGIIEDGEEE